MGGIDPNRLRLEVGWVEVSTGDRGKYLGLYGELQEAFDWARRQPPSSYFRFIVRRLSWPNDMTFVARRMLVAIRNDGRVEYRLVNRFHSITPIDTGGAP